MFFFVLAIFWGPSTTEPRISSRPRSRAGQRASRRRRSRSSKAARSRKHRGSRASLGAQGRIPERDRTQLNAVSLRLFECTRAYKHVSLSVRPPIPPSVCLSVCLFVCLSACLHAHMYVGRSYIDKRELYVCLGEAKKCREADPSIGPEKSFIPYWSGRRRHYVFVTFVRADPHTRNPPSLASRSGDIRASTRSG